MGNNSTKESRGSPRSRSRASSFRQPGSPTTAEGVNNNSQSTVERPSILYPTRSRSSRHDGLLGFGGDLDSSSEPRKETKQEREARKAEKEKVVRARERERSLREESVDGGYLVTLGTYTGPEDFSKPIVRQLMIERRIAPFWRGLNDHSDSWTEHQLVAAARGLPIPAPDEVPTEDPPHHEPTISASQPISFHLPSNAAGHLSASQPVFSSPNTNSPSSAPPANSPLFRGRSKTLVSFTSKTGLQPEPVSQEINLPYEPNVNGQPLEAHLYKDASECPICFLYYPPYLNKTRCCDQPICSECFVQIKRPEPHPPEHGDPAADSVSPAAQKPLDEDMLVSEPAQCPFCVQTEFGVTYEPPTFRRGLAYADHGRTASFVKSTSAMSSSSSLSALPSSGNTVAPAGRRRGQSLSASAPQVTTTDKLRPDWAKKLSDARAHAARRSAAATALHNAAYLMGGVGGSESRFGLGRRRRNLFVSDPMSGRGSSGGPSGMSIPNMEMLLNALERQGSSDRQRANSNDLMGTRMSPRGPRMEDLEELMLMEAIRQSLAAEEDRKRKEEKETAKQAKKDEKQKAKDQKKVDKISKKTGSNPPGPSGTTAFYSAGLPSNMLDNPKGKSKAIHFGDSAPQLSINNSSPTGEGASSWGVDAQRHLELSRANLDSEVTHNTVSMSQPLPLPKSRLRHVSDASSTASSFLESAPGSLRNAGSDSSFSPSPNTSGQHLPFGTQNQDGTSGSVGTESMFNFQSLAAMIGKENVEGGGTGSEHVEFRKQSDGQASGGATVAGRLSNGAAPTAHQKPGAETTISSAEAQGDTPQARHTTIMTVGQYDHHTHHKEAGVDRDY